MLRLYRDLIALRKAHPALSNGRKDLLRISSSEAPRWLVLERRDEGGDGVTIVVNFDDAPQRIPFGASAGSWNLALGTHEVRYGGTPASGPPPVGLKVLGDHSEWVTCPGPGALVYVKSAET
jgi:maltooligosyltrehalose trehalohydrolase